jgi:hypothetical protein
MSSIVTLALYQHLAPGDDPPTDSSTWVTHSIVTVADPDDPSHPSECLWRLKVVPRSTRGSDASPWSYTLKYVMEVSYRDNAGNMAWCPVTAHTSHDAALAVLERQAARLGLMLQ